MITQLCKQHFVIILFRDPFFTSKTYKYAATYNHTSADDNLSFLQPETAITHEQNVIDFGGYFIYGRHFMNCHSSDIRHTHQAR